MEFFCAIRLSDLSVSNHSHLVINQREGSAVRLAWTQNFRWKQAGDLRSSQESEFRLFTWVGLPLERSSQT